jgi:hypothetical protein
MRVLLILSMLLSGCGFKPMLVQDNGGYKSLGNVKLIKVEGKDRLKIERIINESLGIAADNNLALFHLNIKVSHIVSSGAVLKDGQTTRYKIKTSLEYSLFDANSNKTQEIDKGTVYVYSGYDLEDSDFANYIIDRSVSDDALKDLCTELKYRLISTLTNYENTK